MAVIHERKDGRTVEEVRRRMEERPASRQSGYHRRMKRLEEREDGALRPEVRAGELEARRRDDEAWALGGGGREPL